MKNILVETRNSIMHFLYRYTLKPVLFRFDPEKVHDLFINIGKILGEYSTTRWISSFLWNYNNPSYLTQKVCNIEFKNPVGLSAGFDKNAVLNKLVPHIGFGFTEIGSVTGAPCSGNPKPRLWRLPKSKSLAVYYGLKNDGCEKIAQRLRQETCAIPLGINIAKTNDKNTVEEEAGIADYFKAYKSFSDIGDYVTINISCPNAFGGLPFTDSLKLEALLKKIFSIPKIKPVFLKMAPDLTEEELDKILAIARKFPVDGFVCTNLTKNRQNQNIMDEKIPELGGFSGKIVDDLSDNFIRHIYKKTGGKFTIIGAGGVFNADDAYRKIKAGASLIELITGMIFDGPQVMSDINLGLVKLLKRDGYRNISEAIGKE